MRRVLVLSPGLALIALTACAATAPAAGTHARVAAQHAAAQQAAAQQAAAQQADALLADVVLPAGAQPVRREPAGSAHQLDHPVEALYYADQVNRHRFWVTRSAPREVTASFDAHPPPHAHSDGYGYGGGNAFAAFAVGGPRGERLGEEVLALSAVTLTDGMTGVRADAEVQYLAPRPLAQQVPRSARVLDVSVVRDYPHHRVLRSAHVTRVSVVRRIAAIVDSLPASGHDSGIAFSCPGMMASTPFDTFTFRAVAGGPALAVVSLAATTPAGGPAGASPCSTASLFVRHRSEPGLYDGGTLLRRASRILHIRLR